MKIFLIAFIALMIQLKSNAQFPTVNIPRSEVRKIISSIVNGQEYELQIMLPSGYNTSNKTYPVLYLMDSQWDFPLLNALYGEQYFDGFIPEMIIVGVTWGGFKPNPDSLRARDYTPTKEDRLPQSGGAAKYLSFMKNELFPFIEKNYKADSKGRVLMGCSLGGLFTLFALFTEPGSFDGYVAASPAFGWNNEIIYTYEQKYFESKPSFPARLYMTVGGVERSVPGFEKLVNFLNNRNYQSLKIKSLVLENTGHSGTKGEGYARGLQYIYEKPKLNISEDVLNKYTGSYEFTGDNKIEIKIENGNLVFYFSPNYKYVLYAEDESNFYSTSEFFKIHFTTENNKVKSFQLERFGGSQIAIKK